MFQNLSTLQKQVIVASALVLGILLIILIAVFSQPRQAPIAEIEARATEVTTNQDTGELIENDPNVTPESNNERSVALYGFADLIDSEELFDGDVNFITYHFEQYAANELKGEYSSFTIRPQGLKSEGGVITTTLRLGDTDILLPLRIQLLDNKESRLQITGREGIPSYDSGVELIFAD